LNPGLHTCKVGAVLLETHLQSILLWLFWRWAVSKYLPGLILTLDFLISAFQVARIKVPTTSVWLLLDFFFSYCGNPQLLGH
jgi:hypothetical protein